MIAKRCSGRAGCGAGIPPERSPVELISARQADPEPLTFAAATTMLSNLGGIDWGDIVDSAVAADLARHATAVSARAPGWQTECETSRDGIGLLFKKVTTLAR